MNNTKENAWNFASLFLFFALAAVTGYFMKAGNIDIREISTTDLIILALAIYRVTRVVVFEKIFKYFRDFVKANNRVYFMRTLSFIITCPWCAGVWIALVMVIFFYFIPFGVLLVYIMALSGVASFLVMVSNYLGLGVYEKEKNRDKKTEPPAQNKKEI
ncbi:MAG: DUF1360 domain-containing protein [Mariniphaga sp.]|nr:DUF1360 domain-containing protein [Mariniphaga sp.]